MSFEAGQTVRVTTAPGEYGKYIGMVGAVTLVGDGDTPLIAVWFAATGEGAAFRVDELECVDGPALVYRPE